MTAMEAVTAHNRMGVAIQKTTHTHEAFSGSDLRVLMTVAANGGAATHHDVRDQGINGTQVRRSSLVLRAHDMITVEGSDGGRNRKGIVTRMRLTDTGRKVCDDVTTVFNSI